MRWAIKEEIQLKEIYENNSKEFIIAELKKLWTTICRKARKLNLHRNPELINKDRQKRGPRKDSYNWMVNTEIETIYQTCRFDYLYKHLLLKFIQYIYESRYA